MLAKLKIFFSALGMVLFGATLSNMNSDNVKVLEKMPELYTICLIGDVGTGEFEQKLVAKHFNEEKCSEVRVLGDVIYENGLDDAQDDQFFEKFYDIYKKGIDKAPWYIALGNHDHYGAPEAWLEIADEYENIKFPNYWYLNVMGKYCLWSLDTQTFKLKKKSPYKDQLKWFEENFNKHGCEKHLVFGHHPYFSSGEHGNADYSRKKAYDKLLKHKVHYFFAGHDHHQEYYGLEYDIHHVIQGAGGKLRSTDENGVWASTTLGYSIMTKTVSGFTLDFYGVDEESGEKSKIYSVEI